MTFPAFPLGETVTLKTRTRSGVDSDGNDVFTVTSTDIDHVAVWPRNSSELVQGQDTSIEGLTMILPPDQDVTVIDAVTVGGLDYEVDGKPEIYRLPWTGATVQAVNVTRVEG